MKPICEERGGRRGDDEHGRNEDHAHRLERGHHSKSQKHHQQTFKPHRGECQDPGKPRIKAHQQELLVAQS